MGSSSSKRFRPNLSPRTASNLEVRTFWKDEEDIVNDILDNLEPQEHRLWQEVAFKDLIQFHSTLGRSIRNYYKLWHQDCPMTSCALSPSRGRQSMPDSSPFHPDAISQRIIEKVWCALHGANWDEQVAANRAYWLQTAGSLPHLQYHRDDEGRTTHVEIITPDQKQSVRDPNEYQPGDQIVVHVGVHGGPAQAVCVGIDPGVTTKELFSELTSTEGMRHARKMLSRRGAGPSLSDLADQLDGNAVSHHTAQLMSPFADLVEAERQHRQQIELARRQVIVDESHSVKKTEGDHAWDALKDIIGRKI